MDRISGVFLALALIFCNLALAAPDPSQRIVWLEVPVSSPLSFICSNDARILLNPNAQGSEAAVSIGWNGCGFQMHANLSLPGLINFSRGSQFHGWIYQTARNDFSGTAFDFQNNKLTIYENINGKVLSSGDCKSEDSSADLRALVDRNDTATLAEKRQWYQADPSLLIYAVQQGKWDAVQLLGKIHPESFGEAVDVKIRRENWRQDYSNVVAMYPATMAQGLWGDSGLIALIKAGAGVRPMMDSQQFNYDGGSPEISIQDFITSCAGESQNLLPLFQLLKDLGSLPQTMSSQWAADCVQRSSSEAPKQSGLAMFKFLISLYPVETLLQRDVFARTGAPMTLPLSIQNHDEELANYLFANFAKLLRTLYFTQYQGKEFIDRDYHAVFESALSVNPDPLLLEKIVRVVGYPLQLSAGFTINRAACRQQGRAWWSTSDGHRPNFPFSWGQELIPNLHFSSVMLAKFEDFKFDCRALNYEPLLAKYIELGTTVDNLNAMALGIDRLEDLKAFIQYGATIPHPELFFNEHNNMLWYDQNYELHLSVQEYVQILDFLKAKYGLTLRALYWRETLVMNFLRGLANGSWPAYNPVLKRGTLLEDVNAVIAYFGSREDFDPTILDVGKRTAYDLCLIDLRNNRYLQGQKLNCEPLKP